MFQALESWSYHIPWQISKSCLYPYIWNSNLIAKKTSWRHMASTFFNFLFASKCSPVHHVRLSCHPASSEKIFNFSDHQQAYHWSNSLTFANDSASESTSINGHWHPANNTGELLYLWLRFKSPLSGYQRIWLVITCKNSVLHQEAINLILAVLRGDLKLSSEQMISLKLIPEFNTTIPFIISNFYIITNISSSTLSHHQNTIYSSILIPQNHNS